MHPDQIHVRTETVRRLVDEQFPQWRDLPVIAVESTGTVNALFRIGDRLSARFPLRTENADEVRTRLKAEAAAARELAGQTPFATPEPVAFGEPGHGYPLPWSVQTWLPGTAATHADPGDSISFAEDMARFIAALRSVDTKGRQFAGTNRGGDLQHHDEWMETCFQHSERLLDVPRLRELWRRFRDLPHTAPDVMSHGDLTPGNVLVADGRLVGLLDVGGFGPADPALDLVGAWHLLENAPRGILREQLGSDDLEWQRGKAWAFEQSMGAVWYYVTSNPSMSHMGQRTLDRILAVNED